MFEFNETLEQARTRNIADALREDVGRGDWTAQLVPASRRVRARVTVREAAVLAGRDWFEGCVRACSSVSLNSNIAKAFRLRRCAARSLALAA